ncbi:MAG: SH3 domain-containing protein [Treponema sp.]|nr:SH3 domain-containing protein [Treponema sp.]
MKKLSVLFTLIILTVSGLFAAPSKIIMLRDNGPLRKANDSNGVEWSETVRAGTELELASSQTVIKDLVTSSKTYTDVEFYEVKYNKNTYYVQLTDAEPADGASVIQEDAVLFTRPTLKAFRNAMLETGTFVVAGDTTKEMNITYRKIIFYDTNEGVKRTRYVNSENISSSDKDVKAVILLETARATQNEELQKELLNNAKSIKTSILIEGYITREINKILNISTFSDDTIEQYEAYAVIYDPDGSKINVRSMPGTAGEVVGQIESADTPAIYVSLRTESTETINKFTDHWYYITEPETGLEGWVFGGFIGFQ